MSTHNMFSSRNKKNIYLIPTLIYTYDMLCVILCHLPEEDRKCIDELAQDRRREKQSRIKEKVTVRAETEKLIYMTSFSHLLQVEQALIINLPPIIL